MNNEKFFSTNLKLDKEKGEHVKAYEYLMSYDKKVYKSYSNYLVAAVVDFAERQVGEQEIKEQGVLVNHVGMGILASMIKTVMHEVVGDCQFLKLDEPPEAVGGNAEEEVNTDMLSFYMEFDEEEMEG